MLEFIVDLVVNFVIDVAECLYYKKRRKGTRTKRWHLEK